jgi:hypothetical protein
MRKIPKDYDDISKMLEEVYDLYSSFVICATAPSGNLNSYTQKQNQTDNDFVAKYKKLKVLIDS